MTIMHDLQGPWSDIDPDDGIYTCYLCEDEFFCFGPEPAYHDDVDNDDGGYVCALCAGFDPPSYDVDDGSFESDLDYLDFVRGIK